MLVYYEIDAPTLAVEVAAVDSSLGRRLGMMTLR